MSADPSFELVVVGGGNMGAALVGGLLAGDTVARTSIAVIEPSAARRDQLVSMFPGVAILERVPSCAAAVVAVKPGVVAEVARAVAQAGATRLLSVAAGVTTAALEASTGGGVAVVRSMPNTPALVGAGVSAIAPGSGASDDDLAWAESILGVVGLVVRVAEHQLDAVTGLTGSGPAYLFLVAEAMVDAGVAVGLARADAERMVTQLFVGSSALLAERGDAAGLRAMVTSPGGTTAAGLGALEDRAVRAAFQAAVRAATSRSRELGA
jgi:pyrroline-5-carboxylate reductase